MPIQHRLAEKKKKQEETEAARRRRAFIANLPITRKRAEVGEFIQQQGFEGLLVFYWQTLDKDGPHNGRCWVTFDDEATAQRAISTINNMVYDCRKLRVEVPIARGPKQVLRLWTFQLFSNKVVDTDLTSLRSNELLQPGRLQPGMLGQPK